MSRPKGKVPAYSHHKASGRAVVRLDGHDHYLGPYGSPQSHETYARLVAEWQSSRAEAAKPQGQSAALAYTKDLTVAEVLYRYREFARGYYAKDGKPTKQFTNLKYAFRPLRLLYGSTLARDFGPLALKALRQTMVESDLSRGEINKRIKHIKRFWKWAVSEELVAPSVFEAIRTVEALRYGRTAARETEPVRPVPDAWIEATHPHLSRQVAAMVQLQRLTGMRPCEVVLMRACEIDMSGKVWIYEPPDHKNRWRGKQRLIPLGPRAQATLRPFVTLKTDAFLFSPRQAEEERNATRRALRQTPMTPSQARRQPKAAPKRAKRERYDVDAYRRAIKYAIKKANAKRPEGNEIPSWCPLQLRHSRATEVRKGFGIEAAQVSLGHSHADVTQIYAERNLDLALEIAEKTG